MTPNELAVQELHDNVVMLDGKIVSLKIEALEFDDTILTIAIAPEFPHLREWHRATLECRTVALFDWILDASRNSFGPYNEGVAAVLPDGSAYLSFDPYDARTQAPDHERDGEVITCKSLKVTLAMTPTRDLAVAKERALKFYVSTKSARGERWVQRGPETDLATALVRAKPIAAYEVAVFVESSSGGSLYWSSRMPDVYNSLEA